LSTRPSKSLGRALTAIGCAVGLYAALIAGFGGFATWAEAHGHAHPYGPGEEMFRFLLPSVVGRPGRDRIMLIGSSTAQEALQYEQFEAAFPGTDAYQVSYSEATLDDILVALDYVARAYGEAALPDALVVGLETRSLANLPRTFGPNQGLLVGEAEWDLEEEIEGEYLFAAINQYSPYFSVTATDTGSMLVPKAALESWWARLRFATQKQQPRYRSALAALLNRVLNGPGPNLELALGLPELVDIRNPFARRSIGVFARWIAGNPTTAFRSWIAAYVGPYAHRYPPTAEFEREEGAEAGIGFWDPDAEAELVSAQLRRLRERSAARGIQLFVVLVPEHPFTRSQISSERDAALLLLVQRALGDTPFIDLRSRFGADVFADDAHVRAPAAQLVTAEVIRAVEAHGGLGK
jgi:hypothetical protein